MAPSLMLLGSPSDATLGDVADWPHFTWPHPITHSVMSALNCPIVDVTCLPTPPPHHPLPLRLPSLPHHIVMPLDASICDVAWSHFTWPHPITHSVTSLNQRRIQILFYLIGWLPLSYKTFGDVAEPFTPISCDSARLQICCNPVMALSVVDPRGCPG